jgi:hypothetical protein
VLKAFSFARMMRYACLTWPARIGPQLAAAFELDAAAVTGAGSVSTGGTARRWYLN